MPLVASGRRSRRAAGDARPADRPTLEDLPPGGRGRVSRVRADDARVARRLADLGLRPGADVELVRVAPMGDPVVVRVADYELALRRAQARTVELDGGRP